MSDQASSNNNPTSPNASNQVEGQPNSQVQKPQAANESPAQAAIRKMKLKIDGQEQELPEDEVIKWAQLGRSSDKRFKEASQKERQAKELINLIKTNPVKVLQDPSIGHDFRKLAEEYLAKQLEDEMLSPEQKRIKELEAKLKEQEDREKEELSRKEQGKLQELQEHYAQEYDKNITEALKTSGLPKSPKTVKRMAELMYMNLQHGFELEPIHLVELVRQDYLSEIQGLFGQTDEDTLLALLGDGIANKIRKADLKRLKSTPGLTQTVPKAQPTQSSTVEKKISKEDWRERLERIKAGRE